MKTLSLKFVAIAAGLFAGLQVQAHTTVQNAVGEGVTAYNNLVIGHGCTLADGTRLPVIAQSVLFPTVNPRFTVAGPRYGSAKMVSITSFANVAQLIQNRDIFSSQREKTDARGNVIGFEGTDGSLSPDLHGLVPFRTAGVTFPGDSCATKLVVQVAIADICQKNGAANLWIPALTSKYADPTVDGIGAPASLTFNRDLLKNPLSGTCGPGYTVTVTPSPEDVDANLKLDGYLK